MNHSIALVTGINSGVGYATARALAGEGWQEIIVTERNLAYAQERAAQLMTETKLKVFTPLELNMDRPTSVQSTLDQLIKRGLLFDFLVLNADMAPDDRLMIAETGEETWAPLLGYHQLTAGLLRADLLDSRARIVIAGSEAIRAKVPTFSLVDVADLATANFRNDRRAVVETLLRTRPPVTNENNRAYIEAKLIVVWWAAALARRLPSGIAMYAVGAATDTRLVQRDNQALKYLFIPIVNLIPDTNQPAVDSLWYLQAAKFGADDLGEFFALAPRTFTGPIEAIRHLQFQNSDNQEATWKAVVNVSGIDLSSDIPSLNPSGSASQH